MDMIGYNGAGSQSLYCRANDGVQDISKGGFYPLDLFTFQYNSAAEMTAI